MARVRVDGERSPAKARSSDASAGTRGRPAWARKRFVLAWRQRSLSARMSKVPQRPKSAAPAGGVKTKNASPCARRARARKVEQRALRQRGPDQSCARAAGRTHGGGS
ncbi:hypothetical protein T492DRAFT_994984, partial [Pavlovales sp. CCMP2436]